MEHKRITFALAALTVSIVLAFAVGLSDAGQESVLRLIGRLDGFVEAHFWIGIVAYVLAFGILITLTLPMATVFTAGRTGVSGNRSAMSWVPAAQAITMTADLRGAISSNSRT